MESALTTRSGRITSARKLLRPATRRRAGWFLAEGRQAVSCALEAGVAGELFVGLSARERHDDLIVAAHAAGIPVRLATDEAVASLSETVTPQGLVVTARPRPATLEQLVSSRPRLVAVLAEIRDPGNAGTVLRTADAAGADAVVFAGDTVDPYGGKAVRASAGSVFHLPVVSGVTLEQTAAALRAGGCRILAADGHAAGDLDEITDDGELDGPVAWVFGNEAHGLAGHAAACWDRAVRVPVYGRAESLNLATAAAVCLYASARAQRPAGRTASRGGGPGAG